MQTFAPFTAIANTFLVIAGSLLFFMQVHGYLHTTYPDDFGFSTLQHTLDHFDNDIPSGDNIQDDQAKDPPSTEAPTKSP